MLRFDPRFLLILAAMLVCAARAGAQDVSWAAATSESAPPAVLAEPLRSVLHAESADITRGDDRIRFWGVRALAITGEGGPDWSHVPAGALIGALQTEAPLPDIRGVPIRPGVYTLRFVLQPQDGDHMGVSPHRQFLVVAPAAEDLVLEPVGYEGAVALGKKTHRRSHPAVLSIDPPAVRNAPESRVAKTEDGHTAVVLGLECTRNGAPAGVLAFGLVLVGQVDF